MNADIRPFSSSDRYAIWLNAALWGSVAGALAGVVLLVAMLLELTSGGWEALAVSGCILTAMMVGARSAKRERERIRDSLYPNIPISSVNDLVVPAQTTFDIDELIYRWSDYSQAASLPKATQAEAQAMLESLRRAEVRDQTQIKMIFRSLVGFAVQAKASRSTSQEIARLTAEVMRELTGK